MRGKHSPRVLRTCPKCGQVDATESAAACRACGHVFPAPGSTPRAQRGRAPAISLADLAAGAALPRGVSSSAPTRLALAVPAPLAATPDLPVLPGAPLVPAPVPAPMGAAPGTPAGLPTHPAPTPLPAWNEALPSTWEMPSDGPSFTRVTGLGALRAHGVPERIPGTQPGAFKLTPTEGFLLGLADGATNADDIVAASGLKLLDAAWAFYRLKELGLIRFREDEDQQAALRDAGGQLRAPEPAGTRSPALGAVSLQRVAVASPFGTTGVADAGSLLRDAQACIRAGDLAAAREKIRQATGVAPGSEEVAQARHVMDAPEAAHLRAHMLHDAALVQLATHPFQALRLWELALAEFEPQPVIHHHLAMVLHQQGQSPQRVTFHLSRVLQLDPGNDGARRMLDTLKTGAA